MGVVSSWTWRTCLLDRADGEVRGLHLTGRGPRYQRQARTRLSRLTAETSACPSRSLAILFLLPFASVLAHVSFFPAVGWTTMAFWFTTCFGHSALLCRPSFGFGGPLGLTLPQVIPGYWAGVSVQLADNDSVLLNSDENPSGDLFSHGRRVRADHSKNNGAIWGSHPYGAAWFAESLFSRDARVGKQNLTVSLSWSDSTRHLHRRQSPSRSYSNRLAPMMLTRYSNP